MSNQQKFTVFLLTSLLFAAALGSLNIVNIPYVPPLIYYTILFATAIGSLTVYNSHQEFRKDLELLESKLKQPLRQIQNSLQQKPFKANEAIKQIRYLSHSINAKKTITNTRTQKKTSKAK